MSKKADTISGQQSLIGWSQLGRPTSGDVLARKIVQEKVKLEQKRRETQCKGDKP